MREAPIREVGVLGDWVAHDVTGCKCVFDPRSKFPSYDKMSEVGSGEWKESHPAGLFSFKGLQVFCVFDDA